LPNKSMSIRIQKPAFFIGIVLCVMLIPLPSLATNNDVYNVPRLSRAPKIDGILDNPIWAEEALIIEDFHQMSPKEMGAPSEKTVAYIGYDIKNLYLAFRCYDSDAAKIRASVTNRDNCFEDDWIMLMLDTFNEKQRAFGFMINPLGVQIDFMRIESGGNDNMDMSWDMVFESAGRIDEDGYVVEMALPFKGLRFPDKQEKIWGIVIGRISRGRLPACSPKERKSGSREKWRRAEILKSCLCSPLSKQKTRKSIPKPD
jgi:hypothetical protein